MDENFPKHNVAAIIPPTRNSEITIHLAIVKNNELYNFCFPNIRQTARYLQYNTETVIEFTTVTKSK